MHTALAALVAGSTTVPATWPGVAFIALAFAFVGFILWITR